MNIISTTFLVSFTVFFIIYWLLKGNCKLQNLLLLIASYVFYSLIDWRCLILLLATSFTSYFAGIFVERPERHRKTILVLDILFNVGILFVFKYFNFFAQEFATLIGLNPDRILLNLILPVGISFYTFTAVGYVVDVYKGKVEATREVIPVLNFLSFFPLILSGPIERSNGLLPQFCQKRDFDYNLTCDGIQQIVWGLFKKVVIADNCASIVHIAFANYHNLPASSLTISAVLYSIQIYCDFSGYSDMAIGLSKTLGFRVKRNFNYPYFSLNVADFWRRWHMSLQSWLADYIYIPLGGSRCSKARVVLNTFIVFVVCGIWHGANWTFIAWGTYHAILFVPLLLFFSKEFRRKTVCPNGIFPKLSEMGMMLLTFILITLGWIVFNSATIHDAFGYITGIINASIISKPIGIGLTSYAYLLVLLILLTAFEWTQRNKEYALQFKAPGWVKVLVMYALIAHVVFYNAAQSDFIYFQF